MPKATGEALIRGENAAARPEEDISREGFGYSRASARYEAASSVRGDKYDRTRMLLEWVGRGKRVLEVGCSTGYISRLLAERGCVVTGIEIDPAAAERARAHCREVLVLDLNSPLWSESLRGGAYDVVLLADVLEHLVDPGGALREIRGLLKEDGSIVISLPNVVHWVTRARILLGQFNYTSMGTLDHTHLRFYTVGTAHELVRSAGYQIIRFHPAIGGRLNGHARAVWQWLAWTAPGLFAYQILFEARNGR